MQETRTARTPGGERRKGLALTCVVLGCVGGLLGTVSRSVGQGKPTEKPTERGAGSAVAGVPGTVLRAERGVLEAVGSAAADLYAASAEVARLKAERLARVRAEERLKRALSVLRPDKRWTALPKGSGETAPDVTRATVERVEYGVTGSVTMWLSLSLIAAPRTDRPDGGDGGDGGSSSEQSRGDAK